MTPAPAAAMTVPMLQHGDCLDLLRAMPAASVDLVFCSPPYEAARTYGIDFALKGQDWVDWCVPRYRECLRVCKGLVAWVVEGQTRQYRYSAAPALLMADLHRAGVHLRKPPAFARVGIPGSGGPDWLRNDWEWIICATNGGKLAWSDNVAMGHKPKWGLGGEMSNRLGSGARINQWGKNGSGKGAGARRANGTIQTCERPSHIQTTKGDGDPTELIAGAVPETVPQPFGDKTGSSSRAVDGSLKKCYYNGNGAARFREAADGTVKGGRAREVCVKANPGNVLKIIVGGGVMGHKLAHENEAPFPQKLAEFFVRSFCPPGGTVLDCFCGSGTTLAAAMKYGRVGMGMDIRESQIELTRRRLADAEPLWAAKDSA